MEIPELLFDRSKPFYPMVMAFYSSVHGSLDLVARRMVDVVPPEAGKFLKDPKNAMFGADVLNRFIGSSKTPLLFDKKLGLESRLGQQLDVYWDELEIEMFDNFRYLLPYVLNVPLRMLILSCYEVVKEQKDGNDPEWEFFFHCRNAAGHNGNFKFRHERGGGFATLRTAKWGGLEITTSLEGAPLLYSDDSTMQPFLKQADVLRLLHAIEQKVSSLPTAA